MKRSTHVMSVVKLSHVPTIFAGLKEVILERNLNILSVLKSLHTRTIPKGMKEFLLEKNTMKVFNVVKTLHPTVIYVIKKKSREKPYE